jgi:energy-coupling factor transporter ATP-binding protein EcfA2
LQQLKLQSYCYQMEEDLKLRKAATIDEIYSSFKYRPLEINEIDEFYHETEKVRGGKPARRRIARMLEKEMGDYQHILLVGYKGSGKSTELNHLQKDIQDEYLVINYSVMDELDPIHLNYIELFIVTLERLFTIAREHKLRISRAYIKNITHWIQSKEIEEIRTKYNIGVDAEVGAEGKIGIPFLQKFFYKFKMSAKSSRSLKETIKTNIEPKLSDLIEHCNLLVNEVIQGLKKIEKKDLLIIIEDLDKIPIDRAEDLFFNYANQISQLRSNVVFTFPITSYYNIRFNTIRQYFSNIFELPMIKVKNQDQSPFEKGFNALKKIVEKRMDLTLFESPKLLNLLIEKSGGCIRDLFRLIAEAAEHTIDYGREKINKSDCANSLSALKREYYNTIADNYRNGQKIAVETYYKTLVEVAKDATKRVDNTEEILDLRQNLCILGYNGVGWCDVHPIVKEILMEKELWDGKQE